MYYMEMDGRYLEEGQNTIVYDQITGDEIAAEVLLIEPFTEAGCFKVYLRAEEPELNELEDPRFNCKFLCIIPLV